MWYKCFILSILFNTFLASPPGSRGGANDNSHQRNWDSRDDKKAQPSTSTSHLSKYNYGSQPQSVPLDLSIKNRPTDRYAAPSTSAKKESFDCSHCGRSYSTAVNLNTHVNFAHEGKRIICSDCGRNFASYSGMKNHQKSIHRELTFDCTKCGRQFSRKDSLQNHDKEHQENSEIYKCRGCPYQTKNKNNLRSHKSRQNH